jgi:hypothetical protein
MKMKIETPLLVTGFNRPDLLKSNLDSLRRLGAQKLYISIDGPRESRIEDFELVEQCRLIAEEVAEWSEARFNFAPNNLGVKDGMIAAIDWFFSRENAGIILEDDVSIHDDFLSFMSIALSRYKNDKTVGLVSGYSPIPAALVEKYTKSLSDSYFSSYGMAWGWATWKDRWEKNDRDLISWRTDFGPSELARMHGGAFARHWSRRFDSVASGEIDSWDFGWMVAIFNNNWLTVFPKANLTQNLGFGRPDATHTTKYRLEPSLHPGRINFTEFDWGSKNQDLHGIDKWYSEKVFYIFTLRIRLIKKVIRIYKTLSRKQRLQKRKEIL